MNGVNILRPVEGVGGSRPVESTAGTSLMGMWGEMRRRNREDGDRIEMPNQRCMKGKL